MSEEKARKKETTLYLGLQTAKHHPTQLVCPSPEAFLRLVYPGEGEFSVGMGCRVIGWLFLLRSVRRRELSRCSNLRMCIGIPRGAALRRTPQNGG